METSTEYVKQESWPFQLWCWGPALSYAAAIFYFSSQPNPEEQLPDFLMKQFGDKLLHLIEYAILAVLCYRAFRWAAGSAAARRSVTLAIVAASAYAVTDEVHQMFVPLREASWLDWVADTIGATIGSFGWSRFFGR